MNLTEERDFDDFRKAQLRLAKLSQKATGQDPDQFMRALLDQWLRDKVPSEERFETAQALCAVADEKNSPMGWIRTVIENGSWQKALHAVQCQARAEQRRGRGVGITIFQARDKIKELWELKHGEIRNPRTMLDNQGGMPLKVLANEDARLHSDLIRQCARYQEQEQTTVLQNGASYSCVPAVDAGMVRDAAQELCLAIEGAIRSGVDTRERPTPKVSVPGAQVETIQL